MPPQVCRTTASRLSFAFLMALAAVATVGTACRRGASTTPPVATPSLKVNRDKAPLGSPIELTYKFAVANDAHFDEDYRVMMHVVDADGELMWTDDHVPPTPTTQWKPGQTVEYTRTIFVPVYPYVGQATLQLGLYSTTTQKRLTLAGDDAGQHAYKVATLQLQPQSENLFTVFKDGWHPTEVADHNASVEWQWTMKQATIDFKNPKKDSVFYLDVDQPGGVFNDTQHVQVKLNGKPVDEFDLAPKTPLLRRTALTSDQLGNGDMAEIEISVDRTFVPAQISGGTNKDSRELGIRVFHAFVQPNS